MITVIIPTFPLSPLGPAPKQGSFYEVTYDASL
jgi:hypothetical protein